MKASDFADDVAEMLSKALEKACRMFEDIYDDFLRLAYEAVNDEDLDCIKDRTSRDYVLPCSPAHACRRSVKLWRVNRAVFRVY